MNFTTPCFVRVENPEERKELIEWLKNIGYDECNIFIADNYITVSSFLSDTAHDCGTNIQLFKALAAMNGENDYMQWFCTDDLKGWIKNTNGSTISELMYFLRKPSHKATADEIIEYFAK